MARPKRNYIPVIPVVLLIALIVPVSGAGFFPDGGTFSDPVEITINSTIDAWTEVQPDAESLRAYRWRFNPAAFTIVSGDDHSRNVTFRAIKETKKPEAISYSRRDCSANSSKDSLCSTSEKALQKYWRIIRVSPPAAGISVKQSSEGRSASVRFTDLSTGSPSSWSWDFGDGWGSSDQNPEHTYEKSGKYTVTLRTANKGGNNSATTTVDVEIPEPAVNAGSPGPDTVSQAGSVVANGYPSGTVSVLHFNTPGSVSDEIGHVWHTENLLYSDTVYKFGGSSALFNGASWLSTDDAPEFSPNSENFTFSTWVYPTSALNGYGTVWGNWWCCGVGGSSLDFMGGKPRIVIDNYGTKIITGTKPLPLNTWSNVVLQGKNVGGSSDVTLYVNGMPNGTLSGSYNIRKPVSQTKMFMGRSSTMFYLLQAGTYIDDFFIVKGGPAMYEGPFTPPTQEFGTQDPAHCGYDTCDDINDQTDYDTCVACNSQTYCEGLCANPNCDLSGNQVTFGIENYTCSFGNWQIARCGQNALLNWALEGDTAQFNDVLSTARWRRTDSCPNMGHSYAFDNPGGKDVYMAGVVARDVGFFHEIAAELVGADPSNFDNWRFFNYGELNIIKGGGTLGFPIGQIPAGGTTCYTKVSVRKILGLNGCLVIDDPPQIVKTFYIDQSLQIQPNQNEPACGEHTTLKLLQRTQKSQNNYNNLPDELKKVLDSVKFTHQFATSRLDIDSVNQSITVYTYGIRDEQKMNSFDGRKANNYTIRMVHDTEFEKTVQDVKKHLNKFQDNPDYQISRISMVSDPFGNPPGNYIELWVNQLTPENKELDNTTIDGWMIQVYPESR